MSDTTTTDEVPVDDRKPYKDVDGNVIDAPTIPSFEREIADAQNRADQDAVNEATERYHKARDEKVEADNKREQDRRKENK